MWTTFFFAAILLMTPTVSLGQEADVEISTEVDVEVRNLGQTIKANCEGLSGLKRVVCLRETKQKDAKSQARGKSVRGRERAAKAFESFEGARGVRLKDVGAGKVKQKVRTSIPTMGGKVQKMTSDERRILKGKMNVEKIEDLKSREGLRRAKVESLKKRVHTR
ncbi:hypothetical protein HYZ98_00460 [Candidatus Peregrinibacteria bacterium]|nr:hypothetical protein [Candidatus Peregrinibacteria bacterium]